MSGEAGYLSPASPLVPQVLSISLIGLGRVATLLHPLLKPRVAFLRGGGPARSMAASAADVARFAAPSPATSSPAASSPAASSRAACRLWRRVVSGGVSSLAASSLAASSLLRPLRLRRLRLRDGLVWGWLEVGAPTQNGP